MARDSDLRRRLSQLLTLELPDLGSVVPPDVSTAALEDQILHCMVRDAEGKELPAASFEHASRIAQRLSTVLLDSGIVTGADLRNLAPAILSSGKAEVDHDTVWKQVLERTQLSGNWLIKFKSLVRRLSASQTTLSSPGNETPSPAGATSTSAFDAARAMFTVLERSPRLNEVDKKMPGQKQKIIDAFVESIQDSNGTTQFLYDTIRLRSVVLLPTMGFTALLVAVSAPLVNIPVSWLVWKRKSPPKKRVVWEYT